MSYVTWAGDEISVGIKVEEIDAVFRRYFKALDLLVVWVTETEIAVSSIDIYEHCQPMMDVAEKLHLLGRFIPDDEYIAAKQASLPPPLSNEEKCILDGEGHPVYIARPIKLGSE
jgi:hypothetical protein